MKIILTLAISITLALTTCAQRISDSLHIEGKLRTFHFNTPGKDVTDFNLIFVLHGSGGNGKDMMKEAISLEDASMNERIVLVYPDGYKKYWNECRKKATHPANTENVNDIAFFQAMIQYFSQKYNTNKETCFAFGISGGGHMAYKLALMLPEQFKAISALIANLPDSTNFDCEVTSKPVAVMITNSTEDELNPYNGGEMVVGGSSWGEVRSTERTFHYWSDLAGYRGAARKETVPDPNPTNEETITRFTFEAPEKPAVILLVVEGGKHSPPKDLNIYAESLAFFKKERSRLKK